MGEVRPLFLKNRPLYYHTTVLRVAILCPDYPPSSREGGISHYTQCLANHLSKRGVKIWIITNEEYSGNGFDGDIQVLKFADDWNRPVVKKMVTELRAKSIDMVNVQYSPSLYSTGFKLAWPYLSKQFISTVSFHTLWGGSKLNRWFALRLLQSADALVATNSEIIYLLENYLPSFLRKTYFIPISAGIEPSDFPDPPNEIAAKYRIDRGRPLIAYFGMVYPGKGFDLLFQTLRVLLDQFRFDFQIAFIGGGVSDLPGYRDEQEKQGSKFGIGDRSVWTGKIPPAEVSALLSMSELVFLPFDSGVSDRRSSLWAALAHGKATVTTPPVVPIRYFQNGENMLWPLEVKPQTLAEAVYQVHSSSSLRRELEKGAQALASQFSWRQIAQDTDLVFRKIFYESIRSKTA